MANKLYNSNTSEFIRNATDEETIDSLNAGPEGHIKVDGITCYVRINDNIYAEIDDDNVVSDLFIHEGDAGHPDVVAWGHGKRWVYVEEECKVGDRLDVDDNGCATVAA